MIWLGFAFLLAACSLSAQTSVVPEIKYRSVPDFLHLPANLYFGEVTGVAVNSKGHIFVFSRGNTTGPAYGAAAAQLLEFGSDGKFLREIGHNLYAWSFAQDRKSTRLNSSHRCISYAVFCLKKKIKAYK